MTIVMRFLHCACTSRHRVHSDPNRSNMGSYDLVHFVDGSELEEDLSCCDQLFVVRSSC